MEVRDRMRGGGVGSSGPAQAKAQRSEIRGAGRGWGRREHGGMAGLWVVL